MATQLRWFAGQGFTGHRGRNTLTVFGISFEETRRVAEQWMSQSDAVGGISFDGLSAVTGESSRVATALSATSTPATDCARLLGRA